MHAQLLIRIEGTSQKSSLAVSNRPGAIAPNPERPRGAGRGGDNAAPAAPRSLFPPVSRREALREGRAAPRLWREGGGFLSLDVHLAAGRARLNEGFQLQRVFLYCPFWLNVPSCTFPP